MEFARKHVPGFENARMINTPPYIGIRETRRILGEYYLTLEDVLEARTFDDVVALSAGWVDVHDYKGTSKVDDPPQGRQIKDGGSYDIPYRCLVPQQVENLLVAGRSISASQGAQASFRIMGTCMALGQAAGTAAALSAQKAALPRALDHRVLQETLLHQGVYLGERLKSIAPVPKPPLTRATSR